jgi:hypothetical protein
MFAQKPPVPVSTDSNYRQQLEYLYARRTTIDALIESLRDYDHFRAERVPDRHQNSKSA